MQCGSLFAALVVRCTFYWRKKLGTPNTKKCTAHTLKKIHDVVWLCYCCLLQEKIWTEKMRKKCIAHTLKRTQEGRHFFRVYLCCFSGTCIWFCLKAVHPALCCGSFFSIITVVSRFTFRSIAVHQHSTWSALHLVWKKLHPTKKKSCSALVCPMKCGF